LEKSSENSVFFFDANWNRRLGSGCGCLTTYFGDFAMNKNDLISQVADDSGLSKVDATKAVDSVLDNIAGALGNGGEVRLVGFGTFSVSHRKATTGRNPRTGEAIQIKASNQPKFKAGKALKDAVN
jgi:DNA-binding protein HU-beta